jgi:hypothetical protein
MKALIYSLIRAIEFDIDPSIEVENKSYAHSITFTSSGFELTINDRLSARPIVKSQPEQGNQMPLICKPVLAL